MVNNQMLSLITLHIVTEKRKLCNYKGVGLVRVFSFSFFPFEGDLLGSRKQKTLPGEETNI